MSSPRITFGTDGWRGRIADTYTFESVRRCTQGFATYLLETQGDGRPVVIGYDRRFNSEHFAAAAAEVLAGNGVPVLLTQAPTPTPTLAHAIIHNGAVGGVNITASHNPPTDNGYKVRDHHGSAIDPTGLKRIEAAIPDDGDGIPRQPLDEGLRSGTIQYFDPAPAYIEQIRRLVDLEAIRDSKTTLVVDSMWGNGAGWFPNLLGGGRMRIVEIHSEHNPLFPEMLRPEPIPPNVDVGLRMTLKERADVLVITDGDADRLGLGDERGRFVDQLRVFALLAYYLLEVRGERGPIVKTLSTTSMLEKLGRIYHVPVYETGVGFKYVAPKMLEVNALIGGEESGGYAFRNHVPERDGIVAGLYVLDMMVRLRTTPSELIGLVFEKVGPHYYDRIDTPLPPDQRRAREDAVRAAQPTSLGGLKLVDINTLDGYKYVLEDGGWLLIRFSGTEPIVRVYCETTDVTRVKPLLQDGLRLLGLRA